ncbi:MAG: LysM peptidoglycan-binding domain-containing protein [Polyangiaceae bacterium]|nr:LysM peptidoglycan-binding domain-containing protein [Polyangiaceae bacterium]
MPRIHIVKQGESLSGIAKQYGIFSWRTIYDHPENAKLRKARPKPELIHPGDEVYIPDKVEKVVDAATGKTHTYTAKVPRSEVIVRSVTILVHGVNTDAGWFNLVENEMKKYQDIIEVTEGDVEYHRRYVIVPFSWGDYTSQKQGGLPNYAVDEVRQMFENPWVGYDRIYQGHAAVRLKEVIEEAKKLGVQVNVIAHSNGTLETCGALLLGASLDNFVLMGSPLDCDNDRSQAELARATGKVSGTVTSFWSPGDEWAYFKGGIGAFGDNATYKAKNGHIKNVKFEKGAVIEGVTIKEDEVDHSDYMVSEHMPIFSAYIRRFSDAFKGKVKYDEAKVAALKAQADWRNVSYYKEKKNVTLESPEMKKYKAEIDAIKK